MAEVTNLTKTSIAIKFYRKYRWLWMHKLHFLSKVLWRISQIIFSCSIPPTTELEEGVNIAHYFGIVIHQNSKIGKGTMIYQNVTIGSGNGPQIGENCVLGCGCAILGDIKIGNNVKVGANAVVLQDVPDNTTVVGVPGRIIEKVKE